MRYKIYSVLVLAGLLFIVVVISNFVAAGDPMDKDDDFLYSDHDGDEIATWEEFILGTDPYNPDSDFDGLPDYWEHYIADMDPSDAADAHLDFDYLPNNNFSIGERDANFDAVRSDIDVWPANRGISFIEPILTEEGPHYDNYEEYYRTYRDKDDGMKIKLMSTLPRRPDTDGDGYLDPDDYLPRVYNDGLSEAGLNNPDIDDLPESNENTEPVQPVLPDVANQNNQYPEKPTKLYDWYQEEDRIADKIKKYNNNNNLEDIDNDGI